MAVPKVSIVIPTLNRASTLEDTIDKIESQTIPTDIYEVIVVDNASTDDTLRVLEAKSRKYPNLRFFFQPKPGAAATRNAGLRRASGEIVLLIDNDILAEPDLIERHLEYHSQHARASVIGNVTAPWKDSVDPFLRYLRHRGIYDAYSVASGPIDFSYYHTGNVSTPRSFLLEAGCFNEYFFIYGMEDIELGSRLQNVGVQMINGERARATHHYFPTYEEFIDRCEQAGYSLGKLIELHPELQQRFVDNGKCTKLLKPFHRVYWICSSGADSASRWLARREEQRGTGPVSRLLELHYYWSIRYRFFLGYNQYCEHARNGNTTHNVIRFRSSTVREFPMQTLETGKRSARSIRF